MELLFYLNPQSVGQVFDQEIHRIHAELINAEVHVHVLVDGVVFLLIRVYQVYYFQLHLLHDLDRFFVLFVEKREVGKFP